MATITITKNYDDGTLLEEAELDPFKNNTETFLNNTKINDDNIQNAGVTASTKLQDGSISAAKMGTSSVGESNLASSAVTTITLNDLAVTTAKITDSSVTTAKIADGTVATADFAASSVTYPKTTLNYVTDVDGAPGTYPELIVSGTSRVHLWNDVTFNGRPVLIQVFVGRAVGTAVNDGKVRVSVTGAVASYSAETSFLISTSTFKQCGVLNFFMETTDVGVHDIELRLYDVTTPFNLSDTSPTRPTVLILEL